MRARVAVVRRVWCVSSWLCVGVGDVDCEWVEKVVGRREWERARGIARGRMGCGQEAKRGGYSGCVEKVLLK